VPHCAARKLPVYLQRPGPSGTARCSCRIIREFNSSPFQGTFWYHSHFGNQYCDGLRGALIIYDPNDPHKHLYDVDNGEVDILTDFSLAETFSPDGTIITLADWYHIFRPMPLRPVNLNFMVSVRNSDSDDFVAPSTQP
jgi:hypothetical protein